MSAIEVAGFVWLNNDRDPPTLELRLTNGAYVKVEYDTQHHHCYLWFAPNKQADFIAATTAMTGLEADQLAPFKDQAEQATRAHESQQRAEFEADAMSQEDGRTP